MALDYDELPPNVFPAAETANTGLVCHSERENLGLLLPGSWRSDETPDGTRVPFARRWLRRERLVVLFGISGEARDSDEGKDGGEL